MTQGIGSWEILSIDDPREPTWMDPIISFLQDGTLPNDATTSFRIRRMAANFILIGDEGMELYKKAFVGPYLNCFPPSEADYALREVHFGICGEHLGGRALALKIMRQDFYWPTIKQDALEFGVDIMGPFPIATGQRKFIILAVDYFTKWVEAEPLAKITEIIAQLLSERLIPFVALDVRSDRVAVGRALDLPAYFGDAGSREVLHKVGAKRACAAGITLDTSGANYRTVWALSKYFPNVKTFVRAHDVDHGINLEKAGATAVVPETLEPSLQLAAAVLAQAKLSTSEIATVINEFRARHLSELTEICEARGGSLGYGFSRVMSKTKSLNSSDSDDDEFVEGTLAI
ncbi:K(+) efflux antiporter 2, chloroplastic-like [Phalaenopsis equestris]|uniref:K(+) efflux antiporter 2, chloroplastic-like n=1 Tax=Phalaenopsis equestris TaxID=78828 RepID=UPI0009E51885|nr:K(+) efflux antiporter 2, chloroplastic-like [Phalaenopsis equestris]